MKRRQAAWSSCLPRNAGFYREGRRRESSKMSMAIATSTSPEALAASILDIARRAVIEAVRRQLDQFLHTSFNVLPYEGYVAVCERLNRSTPGKFPKKTLLVNTGAEATENAVKIARAYTRRPGDHFF